MRGDPQAPPSHPLGPPNVIADLLLWYAQTWSPPTLGPNLSLPIWVGWRRRFIHVSKYFHGVWIENYVMDWGLLNHGYIVCLSETGTTSRRSWDRLS